MIVGRILLGIVWLLFAILYVILCSLRIKALKFMRAIILVVLGLCFLLAYFAFGKFVSFILLGVGVIFYLGWEFDFAGRSAFRKFNKIFSWVIVENNEVNIRLVLPRVIIVLPMLILSLTKRFRGLIYAFGTQIEVETEDTFVNINI